MELESIGSYILLTFILGFFSIGLLSNFFFPFFMNESGDGAIGIVRSNRNVCIRTDVKLLFNITGVTYVR